MDEIKDDFSKHFNRMKTDLNQINGFTPVMLLVISNGFKNLEEDVTEIVSEMEKSKCQQKNQ